MCPSHYCEAETSSSAMTAAVIWQFHKLPVKSQTVFSRFMSPPITSYLRGDMVKQ